MKNKEEIHIEAKRKERKLSRGKKNNEMNE